MNHMMYSLGTYMYLLDSSTSICTHEKKVNNLTKQNLNKKGFAGAPFLNSFTLMKKVLTFIGCEMRISWKREKQMDLSHSVAFSGPNPPATSTVNQKATPTDP